MRTYLVGLLCVWVLSCSTQKDTPTTQRPDRSSAEPYDLYKQEPWKELREDEFPAYLLQIAKTYETYGRFDNLARFSPWDCATFDPKKIHPPSKPNFSRSNDETSHGRKLYSLFIYKLEHGNYLKFDKPITNQVIVKESWKAEELQPGEEIKPVIRRMPIRPRGVRDDLELVDTVDSWLPVATDHDGNIYHAAEKGPLFIMFQTEPKTPGTDDGWVYGTVTPDGKAVIEVGRIENCMNCHQKAPHGRLFGLPKE